MKVSIDQKQCDACGLCGKVCARYVPVSSRVDGKKTTTIHPQREQICICCGQCLLVCPNNAITVRGISRQDLSEVEPITAGPEHLLSVFAHRRSVRRYRDKPIPREVLEQIVEAVKWVPTAASSNSIGIIIIDDKDKLRAFAKLLYPIYDKVQTALSNPIGRFVLTQKTGKRKVNTLKEFVMPGMHWYKKWYQEGSSDEITRDCQAVMLFHAPVLDPSVDESCVIAAWHAVLMAEVLGVGTCFNGLIPPPCNKIPELRQMLKLPENNEVFASLTMGYPKYKPKKTVQRKLSELRFL